MARVSIGGQSGWTTLALAQQAGNSIAEALQNYFRSKKLKEQQAKLANLKEILAPVLAKRLGVELTEEEKNFLATAPPYAQIPSELAQKKQFIEGLKGMPIEYYKYLDFIAPPQPKETTIKHITLGASKTKSNDIDKKIKDLRNAYNQHIKNARKYIDNLGLNWATWAMDELGKAKDKLESYETLTGEKNMGWRNEISRIENIIKEHLTLKKPEKQNKNTSDNPFNFEKTKK